MTSTQRSGPLTGLYGLACPLLDTTPGEVSRQPGVYKWPDGTLTVLSWLPCGGRGEPVLPGTCGYCVSPLEDIGGGERSACGGEPGDLTTET